MSTKTSMSSRFPALNREFTNPIDEIQTMPSSPPRRIHVQHRAAANSATPPLLFIHGAYVDGRCWNHQFLPYFSALGYDCYAIDLSGHGKSEGRQSINAFGLDDYVDDVLNVIASFERKPLLIAHSMGTIVAERLLEQSLVVGAVLMSPLPPGGTGGAIFNLTMRRPQFFTEIIEATQGHFTRENLILMRDIYFSPTMAEEDLLQFSHLIQPESERAIVEMLMLGWRFVFSRPRLPVLVMGGEVDAIFPSSLLPITARRWNAEALIIPDAGHMLMLEPQWSVAAAHIARWLQTHSG